MNRPNPGQAAALGGAAIAAAAIAIGIAQIELNGQSQPHIWSNSWLLVALSLAFAGLAIAVVFFVAAMFARNPRLAADDDQAAGTAGAAGAADDAGPIVSRKAQPGEEDGGGSGSGTGNVHNEIHDGKFHAPVIQAGNVVYGSQTAQSSSQEDPGTKQVR